MQPVLQTSASFRWMVGNFQFTMNFPSTARMKKVPGPLPLSPSKKNWEFLLLLNSKNYLKQPVTYLNDFKILTNPVSPCIFFIYFLI